MAAAIEVRFWQGIGATTRDQWSRLHDVLADNGGISTRIDVYTVFADCFTKELYQGGRLVWPGL